MGNEIALVERAIADIDKLLVWIAPEEGEDTGRKYAWSAAEDAELRQSYGRIPRPELVQRVTAILQRETGDPQAERSIAAVGIRAAKIGLSAYNGEADELCITAAARFIGISYQYLFDANRSGKLATVRRGKKRYVKLVDLANYYVALRERQLAQGEVLSHLDRDDVLTKQEAMTLTGLGETHIGRYLVSGVITGWRVPNLSPGKNGDWAVQRASAIAYVEAKAEGRLDQLLDNNPAYVELRDKITAQVRAIRQAGRLGERDPLTQPKSHFFPGHFRVSQVASYVGLSAQAVYSAISRGELAAETAFINGKTRYAILPREAKRYVCWLSERTHPSTRYHNKQQQQIAEAGLFSVKMLAERWQVSEPVVHSYVRQGLAGSKLSPRRWGRYCVFERGDVEWFEEVALSKSR